MSTKLNDLAPREGSVHSKKRVGRGIGSGLGKTGGRGVKGQKSRSGVAIKGYEGGQMPIYQRLPKRGFNARNSKHYNVVSLGRIQQAVDAGKLDSNQTVTFDTLKAAGVVKNQRDGVRIVGQGDYSAKLSFEVSGASKGAIEKIEGAGGSLTATVPAREAATADA